LKLIGWVLPDQGITVDHVLPDGSLRTQSQVIEELTAGQGELFRSAVHLAEGVHVMQKLVTIGGYGHPWHPQPSRFWSRTRRELPIASVARSVARGLAGPSHRKVLSDAFSDGDALRMSPPAS